MHIVSRIFGARRHPRAQPSDDEVAAVDLTRMLDRARERGDERPENEALAGLLVGADLTAERHPDPELRKRAAAAATALRNELTDRVGEVEVARLVARSAGPIGDDGTTARRARRR